MGCNSCGCNKCSCKTCTCSTTCPDCTVVCAALVVQNAWNVPACDASAVLSVPGLTTVLIGSYVWNPTYGWFRITAFDSVNGQITVINECIEGNADPGTVVPALTVFVFGAPPGTTNVTYEGVSAGTAYTLTASSAPLAFGTTQAEITITLPGTYLLLSNLTIAGNGLTVALPSSVSASLRRQNNTPADLVGAQGIFGLQAAQTTATTVYSTVELPPDIYTTLNSDDVININANRSGSVPSAGSYEVTSARIVAVKLS